MIRVSRALKEKGLKSHLILQVHDELLVETAIDEIDEVRQILTEGMKEAVSLKVPLEIDIKQGKTGLRHINAIGIEKYIITINEDYL